MTYLILNKGIQKNKLKPFFIFFYKKLFHAKVIGLRADPL